MYEQRQRMGEKGGSCVGRSLCLPVGVYTHICASYSQTHVHAHTRTNTHAQAHTEPNLTPSPVLNLQKPLKRLILAKHYR